MSIRLSAATRRILPAFPLCASLLLTMQLVAVATAEDWLRFRGPTADGQAGDRSAPLEFGADQLRWRTEMPGPGASSPVVMGDRVYLTCYSGYGLDPKEAGQIEQLVRRAICVDRQSGKVLWNHAHEAPVRERPYSGPYITMHGYASSTPICDGELVYYFLGTSGVIAYRPDGEQVWRADVEGQTHAWGSGASPVLHENLLIVNTSAENNGMIALDKQTGEQVWSVTGMSRAWNTPALVTINGETELVIAIQGKVLGLDPLTGKQLWECKGIKAAELCPSPIVHQGVIYLLGHPGGQAIAIKAGGRGDVSGTHIVWELNKGSNVGSPVYHDGHLYWMSDKQGVAYCVAAETGEIVYQERIDPRPGMVYASPVLVGDRIYYVSRQNGTFVVSAAPEYKLLAHNQIEGDDSPFQGSPAVVDGELLLRSDRYLYCVGK